ncbi:Protein of unknown function [Pyronema omphalodes CBS 100304]|uniref:Uncharacterized protein n=1 Tax=Pyronema omphalodes (strain CBS 100304) TaxID=1076935 RepID=U4LUB6_PYROM|nr:Protein of unknown function [Pyronema omphalodes CBS 100304]
MQFHSLLLGLDRLRRLQYIPISPLQPYIHITNTLQVPNEDVDAVGADFAALDEVSTQAARTNNVKGSTCRYFGTAPFCKGKCPGGWDTLYKTHCGGMGDKCCFTGQKACRCRNFNC